MVAVEPQALLSLLTWTFEGAITVILPSRLEPDILKLVDDPGVPDTVAVSVVVPPGAVIVGCKTVPDTAWFTVAALVLLNDTLPD